MKKNLFAMILSVMMLVVFCVPTAVFAEEPPAPGNGISRKE